MTSRTEPLEQLLTAELTPVWQRLNRRQLDAIQRFFEQRQQQDAGIGQENLLKQLLDTLMDWIGTQRRDIERLNANHGEFTARVRRMGGEAQAQDYLLDYARTLGASRWQLAEDKRAFTRWFGSDALTERYQQQLAVCERHLSFSLARLGLLAARYIVAGQDAADQLKRWQRLGLEQSLTDILAYEGDLRVRLAVFACLAQAIRALPHDERERQLADSTSRYIYRLALDTAQPVSLQIEALSLLASLRHQALLQIIQQRLITPAPGDDFFVRQHMVALLADSCDEDLLGQFFKIASHDASPTVRQELANLLMRRRHESLNRLLSALAIEDSAPEVRAHTIHALSELASQPEAYDLIDAIVERGSRKEPDPRVLRMYCHIIPAVACVLLEQDRGSDLKRWANANVVRLTELNTTATDLRVRRWAAQAREALWCVADPGARELHANLRHQLSMAPVQERVSIRLPIRVHDDTLGRVLACLTQQDFGLDVSRRGRRLVLRRWDIFRFRLWRAWYELTHSAPDKRQAGHHTIGRVYYGLLQVPSARLAELSPTKVPGEHLYMADEDSWRPYLPLVDQVISSLDQGWPTKPMKLYSSEGVTEIIPPRAPWSRLLTRIRLTFNYTHYARLRNWDQTGGAAPNRYLNALRELGFRIHFRTYTDPDARPLPPDPSVQRFFAGVVPVFALDWWERYTQYFVSVYQNTVGQLAIFLLALVALFLGRHVVENHATRRARDRLPLVIGGWGTRGKSGTERLKAALFNALGFHVVSKTTGCEAMFLQGYSYRELHEMFLYRPYDKATIWEQANLVKLSHKLRADVFLWECMGLTPAYIRILQRHWMRDDIATITNTYPDHEDIQGPAGVNIPIVMTEFIPRRSTLITSEAEMLPILQQAAQQLGTACYHVSWIDSNLLPSDVLNRFPYQEHPSNIALVLRLAKELGIPRLFALKAMADYVVLDLGVLKVYPTALTHGRRLQFTNGMSANERLGALGNWTRLGFDRQDPEQEPGTWVTTVVNNRADRVARSRVFADMLVNDITGDRHFLIGTNLEGFMGFIEESWAVRREDITLWPSTETKPDPHVEWQRMAKRLRVTTTKEAVLNRLAAMLQGLSAEPEMDQLAAQLTDPARYLRDLNDKRIDHHLDAILTQHRRNYQEMTEFCGLRDKLSSEQPRTKPLDEEARNLLWNWFRSRIEIVHSPYISGEELVTLICEQTPPGYLNRILGLQNIKGPGLDWVYRWQHWDKVHAAGHTILTGNRTEAARAAQVLANFQDYGLLSAEYVQTLVAKARELPVTQSETVQAELALIESNIKDRASSSEDKLDGTAPAINRPIFNKLLVYLERFLDLGDAVRRRRTANQIYRDLSTKRISSVRAADELLRLIKRQKGGWLSSR